MKNLFKLIAAALFTFGIGSTAMAQQPTFDQGWTILEESANQVDVSYAVVQCTAGTSEIHLHVFNENPTAQVVNFTIEVTNPADGSTASHAVSNLNMSLGEMLHAECGSSANANLKFAVPAGFDPTALTVDITYN